MSVIAIGREYGSGGREVGKTLAEKLSLPFYDKELITLAAEKANIHENTVAQFEEQSPVQNVIDGSIFTYYEMPMSDKIFIAQSEVIKEIAEKGDCVIVGRAADFVLKDKYEVISAFIHADIRDRIQRISKLQRDIPIGKMESHIAKIDKRRKKYYEYYTETEWGELNNYDLCLSSSAFGIDGCVEIISKAYEITKL